jgi:hypothetical protein
MVAVRLGFVLFALLATSNNAISTFRGNSGYNGGNNNANWSMKGHNSIFSSNFAAPMNFYKQRTENLSNIMRSLSNNSTAAKNSKSPKTSAPTSAPTLKSTYIIGATQSLSIVLSPMDGLMNTTTQKIWSQVTSDFILSYWNSTTKEEWMASDSTDNDSKKMLFVDNLNVASEVQNQQMFTINSARRRIEADETTHQGLQLTYRNWISYSSILSTNVNVTDTSQLQELLVTLPFSTLSSRALYVATLQKQSREIFGRLLYVSTVSVVSSPRTNSLEQQQATQSMNSYSNNTVLSFFLSNLTWIAAITAATFAALGLFIYLAKKQVRRRRLESEPNAKKKEIMHDGIISEACEEATQTVEWEHYFEGFIDCEQTGRRGLDYVRQKGVPDGIVVNSASNKFSMPRSISVGSNTTKATEKSRAHSSIARTDSTKSSTSTSLGSGENKSTLITSNQSLDQIESVLKNLEPNDFNVAEEFDQIMEEFSRSAFTEYFPSTPTNRLLLRDETEEESYRSSSTVTDIVSQYDGTDHSEACCRPTTTILEQRPSDQPGLTIVCCSDVYDKIL